MPILPITVIIPTYCRAELTAQALLSVCLQSKTPEEVLILDDASSSDSFAILQARCRELAARFAHIRIELFQLPKRLKCSKRFKHLGRPGAVRNIAMQRARQPWLAFLDSDDIWFPEKLQRQWLLAEKSQCKVIHSREIWLRFRREAPKNEEAFGLELAQFRQDLASLLAYPAHQLDEWLHSLLLPPFPSPTTPKIISQKKHKHLRSGAPAELLPDALRKCILGPSTLLLHKSVCHEVGYFDPKLQIAEDYEYFLRIIAKFPVAYCPEYLVAKRDQMQSSAGRIWQLSQQYVSEQYSWIEPFRALALERLLLHRTKLLSPEQQKTARRELIRKLQICLAGAEKRQITQCDAKHATKRNCELKNGETETEIARLQAKLHYWE